MKFKGFIVLLSLALLSGVAASLTSIASAGTGDSLQSGAATAQPTIRKIVIKSKPTPRYTEAARRNGVEGKVIVRVEFKADGTIGSVEPVKELPDGLTEMAIEAARLIKFEPELRDGQPVTRTLNIVYGFRLH
jgi:TonB family protein